MFQRWVRGFLARRLTRTMRRTSAAIKIQKTWRGHTQRSTYLQLRDTTVRLQARARGLMARARHLQLVRNAKSIILQVRDTLNLSINVTTREYLKDS